MKPPVTEEQVVDDGYGLAYENKTPEFIQEALDILQGSLTFLEAALEDNIDTWDNWVTDHQQYVTFLEDMLKVGEPLVDLTNPEAVGQVNKKIEEEKTKHEKDKLEFAEKKKKLEADVSTKRRQLEVVRDALRRAQEKST